MSPAVPVLRRLPPVAALSVLAMAFVLLPTASASNRDVPNNACGSDTPRAHFADRDEASDVHVRSIDCIAALGVTTGAGDGEHYLPAEPVRRDQMASFVARTLEAASHELPAPQDQGFDDVDGNAHEDRINQLAQIGVVQGRDGSYAPDGLVTRAQMATFLMAAASWAHDHAYAPVGGPYFADAVDSVHRANIDVAFEQWLVSGVGGPEYAPHDAVRRDQMATFLTHLADFVHPGQFQNQNQTIIVGPQQAVTQPIGEPQQFNVGARYDGEPFTGPVDIALFPCANADPTDLPVTFADQDDNGLADAMASTDTGQAYISRVNGAPTMGPERYVADVGPDGDGVLDFTVIAPRADCAVVIVFVDRQPERELRLDAGQRPSGPFGVGQVRWQ